MGLSKVIFIGFAAFCMQSVNSASVGSSVCICSREYHPICASDALTYSNNCLLECKKKENPDLSIRFYGECDEQRFDQPIDIDHCICTLEYSPICGSDNETYSNECMLKCEQRKRSDLTLDYSGECGKQVKITNEGTQLDSITEQCICPFIYTPLCGSDAKTYSNECEFNCEKTFNPKMDIKYSGECKDSVQTQPAEESLQLPCVCNLMYKPICGSDGKTYGNDCMLNCAKRQNPILSIKYQGRCDGISILSDRKTQESME